MKYNQTIPTALLTALFAITTVADSSNLYNVGQGETIDLSKIAFFMNRGLEKDKVELKSYSIDAVSMNWTPNKYKKWISKGTVIGESGVSSATLHRIDFATHEMDSEKFKLFTYYYNLKDVVKTRFELFILRNVKVKDYKILERETSNPPLSTLIKAWIPKDTKSISKDLSDHEYEIQFESPENVSIIFPNKDRTKPPLQVEKFKLNQCNSSKYGPLVRTVCGNVTVLSENSNLLFISGNADTSSDYIPYMFVNIDGMDHIVHSGIYGNYSALMKQNDKWKLSTSVKINNSHE